MKFYPEFRISQGEAEGILTVILLAEYVDKEITASSLIRELENTLKSACGGVEEKINIHDDLLDAEDGPEEILKKSLPKIEVRAMRFLLYPLAELVVGADKKVKKVESAFLNTLRRLLREPAKF